MSSPLNNEPERIIPLADAPAPVHHEAQSSVAQGFSPAREDTTGSTSARDDDSGFTHEPSIAPLAGGATGPAANGPRDVAMAVGAADRS